MKRMVRIVLSIIVVGFFTLSLSGCPDRAMAPKEQKETSQWDKKDAAAPAQPETTTPEKK
jgi:hypothetical protein